MTERPEKAPEVKHSAKSKGRQQSMPVEYREAANMSRGIWRASDSEHFLRTRIIPSVERQLGKNAMRGGNDIYLTRETRAKHPKNKQPGSYRTYMMEIVKNPEQPFQATFDTLDTFKLADAEVIIQWPSIQSSGLGEDLAMDDEDMDEDAQEFLAMRSEALEIVDAEEMDQAGDQDTLCLINYGEPILVYAMRSFVLMRRKKPHFNFEYGYVYEGARYTAYDLLIDGSMANSQLIGDTLAELTSFSQMRNQIGNSIDTPQFDDLEEALKALGL